MPCRSSLLPCLLYCFIACFLACFLACLLSNLFAHLLTHWVSSLPSWLLDCVLSCLLIWGVLSWQQSIWRKQRSGVEMGPWSILWTTEDWRKFAVRFTSDVCAMGEGAVRMWMDYARPNRDKTRISRQWRCRVKPEDQRQSCVEASSRCVMARALQSMSVRVSVKALKHEDCCWRDTKLSGDRRKSLTWSMCWIGFSNTVFDQDGGVRHSKCTAHWHYEENTVDDANNEIVTDGINAGLLKEQ